MIHTKKLLYLVFFLTFLSCKKEDKETNLQYLTNDSVKYWGLIMDYPIKTYQGTCYNINGKFTDFTISKNGNKIIRRNYSKTLWSLKNDSTLIENDEEIYKIVYINNDILILNHLNGSGRNVIVLKAMIDQKSSILQDTTSHEFDL